MKPEFRRVIYAFGSKLPKQSRLRRTGGAVVRDTLRMREVLSGVREDLETRKLVSRSPMLYSTWLRQQKPRSRKLHTNGRTIRILVLRPGDASSEPRQILTKTPNVEAFERITVEGARIDSALLESFDLVLPLDQTSKFHNSGFLEIAKSFFDDPMAKLITFDSDILRFGRRVDPTFRPTWSPEMLLGNNYIGRSVAFNVSWLLGTPNQLELSDRGVWSMLLRAALSDVHATHISKVLLSRRVYGNAPTLCADDAQMVSNILDEHGTKAVVTLGQGTLRVLPETDQKPLASIVIPTRHSRTNMSRLLASLRKTDYAPFELIILDNGGHSAENQSWYDEQLSELDAKLIWWEETPFNYNHVNNHGVNVSSGEVLVFLNDDTEIVDAAWLNYLVGFAVMPNIGEVGFQMLEGSGRIQHGGVFVGPGGFADNLFAGLKPHTNTRIGSTDWYRNSLAVTGACAAISRANFDAVGGFDTNFILMGSDVVLGIDQVLAGRRNVVLPFEMVRHYESLTRGHTVPEQDLFASFWRYYSWLSNGDPYISPNVSREDGTFRFAGKRERNPAERTLRALGRNPVKQVQKGNVAREARELVGPASVSREDVQRVNDSHDLYKDFLEIRTVNWFIPEVDMPFFGGINTAFRIANKLRLDHGVKNRFVVMGAEAEMFVRTAIDAAYPGLGADSDLFFYDPTEEGLSQIPPADAAVGTLWLTALHVAKAPGAKRRFYLVQDYEPEFYPASSMFALAEESYRLGLYGLCNTSSMYRTYTEEYQGKAMYFTPAVDTSLFHPRGRREIADTEPVTIFAYARDHFRNCWELVYPALKYIKLKYGLRVKIIVAGARYLPADAEFINLGLMDYRETALHYRKTDIGVTMQISRHPSYLPLELMACGVPMVSPDSNWFKWLFVDGENSKESMRSVEDIVANLEYLIEDSEARKSLSQGAVQKITADHSDWDAALDGIYPYMCAPEG